MSLEIDPAEGEFTAKGERKTFSIQNVTDKRQAFKVKTSDVNLYRVKPVYGFVSANSKTELIVQRLEGPAKEDRLVVQWAEVPDEEEDPMEPFKAGAQSGEVVMTCKAT